MMRENHRRRTMSVDAILEQAKTLTPNELAELIERLQEAADEAAPLTDAQKAELERRLADYRANPNDLIPWEVVRARAEARAKK
jgi:putative addiction module component (TIGR02574 family)